MSTDLQPYPAYKPSGIDWLGDVPAHWDVRRLKSVVDMRVSNVDKHVKDGELPVRLCNYVDVYQSERITEDVPFMRATATASEIARFRLHLGDVLITKDSETWDDIGVPALIDYSANDLICGYHLAVLRPFKSSLDGRFLFRALQSSMVSSQFHVSANGVTRYGLTHQAIKSVLLPLPPLAEQAAIARYLDRADERISRAISAKQRLVELLTEQRQAVIHRAVTRGLDADAPLKPSGVEWLGDVPAHWDVRRLRSLAHISTGNKDTINKVDGGKYPFFVRSQTVESIDTWSFDGEAVLTAGDGVGVGRVFHYIDGRFDYHQRVYKFSDFRCIQGRFFYHYLATMLPFEVRLGTAKSTVDSLRLPMLQNLPVPVAPLAEQAAIARHLDKATADIDAAVENARRTVELLREYRARLVADAVTGRVDVRGYDVHN